MELKEALEILKGICPNGFALVPLISNEKEALQTAISHLETLQRVKEMGGVKKKEEWETCTACGGMGFVPNLPNRESYVCGRCNGNKKIERMDYRILNEALALKDAELAGKFEGLKLLLINEFEKRGSYFRLEIDKVAILIQELILGKKEE